ncbi:OmpA family protein, partial [Lamprobacter modestohalophilus]|uniref:OmpA family protein n=1 Tax=Lamprobacter modestohalophilus TaxID=1064514 RepID=UPI002ADED128
DAAKTDLAEAEAVAEAEAEAEAETEAEAEAEEREQLERQLSIAREERDALVLQTEPQIAELTEALEVERSALAALRDELESTKSALAKAKAEAEADQPVSNLGLSQEDADEIGGQLTETGILVEFEPDELSFDSASAVLPTTNLPTLDRIAKWLEDRAEFNVRIEGHTDSLGSPEINQPLSQQRAEAVRQALIDRGIAAERVVAQGAGSTQPIADNATPEGQRQNRRVEIYLMTAQQDKASAPNEVSD